MRPTHMIVEHLSAFFAAQGVDVDNNLAFLEKGEGARLQMSFRSFPDIIPRREHHERAAFDGGAQRPEFCVPPTHPRDVELIWTEGVINPKKLPFAGMP